MNSNDISQQGQKIMEQVTNTVEKTGKKVAHKVSQLAEGKTEEVTAEVIQSAVDKALDIIQIGGERVREKGVNGERVTLEVSVSIVNLAELKITTDVPGKDSPDTQTVDVELNN